MTREMEKKFIPWQIIASALAGLLLLIGGFLLNDTRSSICKLQDSKLDRIEFDRVVMQINATADRIDKKLDSIIQMHLEDVKKR